jgi:hypothetical protein
MGSTGVSVEMSDQQTFPLILISYIRGRSDQNEVNPVWRKRETSQSLRLASAGFLLGLLFSPEDRDSEFLRNVWLSSNKPSNPEDCILHHFSP